MNDNQTNPTEQKNLLEKVNEKINQTAWNYVIWSLPDLAPLETIARADAALAKKEAEQVKSGDISTEELLKKALAKANPGVVLKPDTIPTTNYIDLDKDKLKNLLIFDDKKRRYSFSLGLSYRAEDDEQKGTLASVTQRIHQYPLNVQGNKIRSLINKAFGYCVFNQNNLFDDNLHKREKYDSADLTKIILTLEGEFGEEADAIPEEVKYLKNILANNNLNREGKTRTSIDPYVIALTSYVPMVSSANKDQQIYENTYRKIIIGALLKQEDKREELATGEEVVTEEETKVEETIYDINERWNKREQTHYTEEEAKMLIPHITMKEMALAAKELGENFEDHAYNAFQHYKKLRKDYMKMLTTENYDPNKQKPEPVLVDPSTEKPGSGLSWMDADLLEDDKSEEDSFFGFGSPLDNGSKESTEPEQ
ncbi:hypothetical protein KY336_01495 [Candidatus Woesearchaeota archaeon]|nr:hypothetical protein [Candidatus Woesearchaeota archaeon]